MVVEYIKCSIFHIKKPKKQCLNANVFFLIGERVLCLSFNVPSGWETLTVPYKIVTKNSFYKYLLSHYHSKNLREILINCNQDKYYNVCFHFKEHLSWKQSYIVVFPFLTFHYLLKL